ELLASLFYNRWKKDPSEKEIINNYIVFSTSASLQPALSRIESSDDQNYQYMLTRLLQKVQRFTTQNPTMAGLYIILLMNYLITSTIELASNKKNSKKDINTARSQDSINLDNYQSNDFGYNTESSNKIQNSNIIGISSDSNSLVQCFVETNFSSNEINLESAQTAVEQYEFCQVHRGEGIIISYGIEKEYPLHIDFTMLPDWVRSLKYELLKIIKDQQFSEYRVDAVKRIQEMGASKANSSLLQINYFESFQLGYYGTKGLAVILETLTEMLVQTKILTTNLCAPQSLSQYLTQVL
ncbi:32105_t:CDS:2, partial [Gigaspora margarita]